MSIVFLSQKLFLNNQYYKQVSANTDYLIIFKNPRNCRDISVLSSQLTPGKNNLTKIYMEATKQPYSYIMINLTQCANEKTKYLSNLFSNIITSYVF